MTTDLKVRWNNDIGYADLIFTDNDLDTDEGLATAVILSLFTDQRASDDDIILNFNADQGIMDKRGWWGDLANPEVEGDKSGSKLWLLDRSKTIKENLSKAIQYTEEALKWMLEDEIAKDIVVEAEQIKIGENEVLALKIQIVKTDGNKINYTYNLEWDATLVEDL